MMICISSKYSLISGNMEKPNRSQIQELIGKHLPDVLTSEKKYNKVKNILQAMRTQGLINVDEDKNWYKL